MKISILLFAAFTTQLLSAQIPWLQTGQQWEFCYSTGWLGPSGCPTLTVGSDTTLAGHVCKKMEWSDGRVQYAYEISDKIFVSQDGFTFEKVYDFDMIEGETLETANFTYQVDSVYVAEVGDFSNVQIQKIQIVNGPYRGIVGGYIVEGIGFIQELQPQGPQGPQCTCGAFFPFSMTCDYAIDGEDNYLRSFIQGNNVFRPAGELPCVTTIATSTPPSGWEMQIYPNPVTTTCRLKHDSQEAEGMLMLFNYAGLPLRRWETLPESLDFSLYPTGLYFLTFYREGRLIWSDKVIKQ